MARTIQDFAKEMSLQFTGDKRNDGKEFRKLADGHPQWMQDVCHEAHGDMFPDDWRYEFIESACDKIAETDDNYTIDDARSEIEADIYTHDLTSWLGSRTDRFAYCDEAMEEFGGDVKDTISLLQLGQVREKEEVFGLVVQALEKLVEAEATAIDASNDADAMQAADDETESE